ncbi:MAG: hypothetical protein QW434_06460 [Pyrobaculum sp.]
MYIELFVVAGQNTDLENSLKKVVEDLRGQVQRPDKIRLATVKIRPDAVDQVLRLVAEPPDKVPPHYRSLVNMLKKYGISKFPAVVVDGVKVGEGSVQVEDVLRAVQERARAEFPELSTLELVPPKPVPSPVQPVAVEPAPPLEVRPVAPPEPPKPLTPPAVPPPPEVRPVEPPKPLIQPPPEVKPAEPPKPVMPIAPPPPPPPAPPPPISRPFTAVVRLVLGRPDNCSECAYYGQLTSRCFLFGFAVANPASPPCKQYVRGGG